MTQFKAVVAADVPANRFLSRATTENGVTLSVTPAGEKPDYRSTGPLKAGQEVNVTITNNPTWIIEAGGAIAIGDDVTVGADGRVVTASGGNEVGYAITAAEAAGQLVTVVKTCAEEGEAAVIADGSVTTPKIAKGAVTDDKLAKPKVDVPASLVPKMVIGTTLETNVLGIVPYEQSPTADHLAMYQFSGALAVGTPQADSDAATKKYVDDKTFDAAAITSGTLATARIPNLAQSKITNLTTDLAAKLTAQKAAAQADSTATDVAGLVADFNALLANLRNAGILASS